MKKSILIVGVVAAIAVATFFFYSSPVIQSTPERLTPHDPALGENTTTLKVEPKSQASSLSGAPLITPPLTPEAQFAVKTLNEILDSKNDNDPRLDTQFRNLTFATKAALRQKYAQLPAEDRNGRGTILFLLGREIKDTADLEFFREALNEAPCLSLGDCTKDSPTPQSGDDHSNLGASTTLAYPQLMALVSLERQLSRPEALTPADQELIWKIIIAAKASPVSAVSRKANELEVKLKDRK